MDSAEHKPQHYRSYVIYENIKKLLEYRKLELVHGSIYPDKKSGTQQTSYLAEEEFVKNIQLHEYVLIEARDKPEKDRRFRQPIHPANKKLPIKTFVLLLDQSAETTLDTSSLSKILERIPGFEDNARDYNLEILIISPIEMNNHLVKKIAKYINPGDESMGFLYIDVYLYDVFSIEIPKHKLSCPHRILPKDEEAAVIKALNTDKKHLPRIKRSDPNAIWRGAEVGDIIEILIPSITSGYETSYRLVRP